MTSYGTWSFLSCPCRLWHQSIPI